VLKNKDLPFSALRIKATFTIQLERCSKHPGHGFYDVGNNNYVKYDLSSDSTNKSKLIPYTFPLADYLTEQANFLNYLHIEVQNMLDFTPNADTSSTKYIAISGVSFNVARIRNTGEPIPGFEFLYKSKNLYTCMSMNNGCVLEVIYIATHYKEYQNMKGRKQSIIPRLKELYKDMYKKPFPENFHGLEAFSTLRHASSEYDINFVVYNFDKSTNKYSQLAIIENKNDPENKKPTYNVLLINNRNTQHLMFMKNVSILTHLHICPKCHIYHLSANNNGYYNKTRFDNHVRKCDGKFHSDLCLKEVAKPYAPHFFKNPLFAYLFAHILGRQ
jgi:hypothetical protein